MNRKCSIFFRLTVNKIIFSKFKNKISRVSFVKKRPFALENPVIDNR